MDAAPLDELYFRWLYDQVALVDEQDESLTYWTLFRQMFKTKYLWLVPLDENRLEDGKALRIHFLREQGLSREDVDPGWIEIECSFLELVVALAHHLEFHAGGTVPYWFWKLMENIDLRGYHDGIRAYPEDEIEGILYSVMFRQYNRHGEGGFFPLREPCEDQRGVELWYQLEAYVQERV
ncbi:hypothetical protein SEA_PHERRYCRUZ_41 [Streptomyces phage PherryCruz]|nr:hypothetical protein SEA_RAVENPUFF_41 [Streptomyces phage RavenPuff]QBZ73468.1 hypothetical protein SEA_PHERRYCRUZ_41 [Streptomyces phage PherryCruz]